MGGGEHWNGLGSVAAQDPWPAEQPKTGFVLRKSSRTAMLIRIQLTHLRCRSVAINIITSLFLSSARLGCPLPVRSSLLLGGWLLCTRRYIPPSQVAVS
ncbi:hypothetical protein CGRA01v4_14769 [Colletotrichum graminicola]|nr:hypothetical protein CGRA01v4_14769 [Colletotrichum graminicola]